jgi:hypothetical protein
MYEEFSRACDAVLRSTLFAPLAAAIRRMLEAGETPETVLALFEKAGATRATVVGLAVEAEVEAVAAEIRARRNGRPRTVLMRARITHLPAPAPSRGYLSERLESGLSR